MKRTMEEELGNRMTLKYNGTFVIITMYTDEPIGSEERVPLIFNMDTSQSRKAIEFFREVERDLNENESD